MRLEMITKLIYLILNELSLFAMIYLDFMHKLFVITSIIIHHLYLFFYLNAPYYYTYKTLKQLLLKTLVGH